MQVNLKNYKPIKKIVRLASVTCVALAIYGCSSIEENTDKEQAMTPEQQQLFILEKIESWSAAEPDIQRILGLEADMQLIINQLASMAELDDDPLGN
jgi:PBP1b-binding outer membrane lipoprotein LpoB